MNGWPRVTRAGATIDDTCRSGGLARLTGSAAGSRLFPSFWNSRTAPRARLRWLIEAMSHGMSGLSVSNSSPTRLNPMLLGGNPDRDRWAAESA